MLNEPLIFFAIYKILTFLGFNFLKINKFKVSIFTYFVIVICLICLSIKTNDNFANTWVLYNFFNFFVACDIWLFGLLEKSFSIGMFRYLAKKKSLSLNYLITFCIIPQIYKRIKSLEENDNIIIDQKIYLTRKGDKIINLIIHLKKFFKIKNSLFYNLK